MIRSLEQNRQLFALLNKHGIDKEGRADLVYQTTAGRTSSSAELHKDECDRLINYLNGLKLRDQWKADTMRKKIIAMAHEMGWERFNHIKQQMEVDMLRINNWCKHRGKFKQELNRHSIQQLAELITQFEIVHDKHMQGYGDAIPGAETQTR